MTRSTCGTCTHLSGYDTNNGENFAAGDHTGQTGGSGIAVADQPHLQFEVHPDGWRGAEVPWTHGYPTPMDERVYDDEEG